MHASGSPRGSAPSSFPPRARLLTSRSEDRLVSEGALTSPLGGLKRGAFLCSTLAGQTEGRTRGLNLYWNHPGARAPDCVPPFEGPRANARSQCSRNFELRHRVRWVLHHLTVNTNVSGNGWRSPHSFRRLNTTSSNLAPTRDQGSCALQSVRENRNPYGVCGSPRGLAPQVNGLSTTVSPHRNRAPSERGQVPSAGECSIEWSASGKLRTTVR